MRDWAVSIHDVAPATWPECERLLDVLAPYRVPVTLLVTPHYRHGVAIEAAPRVAAALRERVRRGDEVVLHGYFHVDDGAALRSARDWALRRLWTDAEGEFAALDACTAAWRLAAGTAHLRRAGLEPAGFVPPAWLLGRAARDAVRASGLPYTSTRDVLLRLPDCAPVRAPSLVYSTRAAWRRTASRYWNRRRLAALASEPRVRVALHPADARFPRVVAEWCALIDRLAAARRPVLESGWLAAAASDFTAASRRRTRIASAA